ncbi:MAG: hypothetical protein MUO21_02095 [Nitrososphaeraceae archaeon]|nr:hypothetical protein [Nitrososphaeraceae archaeon]
MSIIYKNLIISPILLLIITFFILKLNGNITWDWTLIFIPIWCIFGLIFIWISYLYVTYQYNVLNTTTSDLVSWRWYNDHNVQLGFVTYICLLYFSIVLALQLDVVIVWDWFVIFIPLWIISLFWFYWWYTNRVMKSMKKKIKQHQSTPIHHQHQHQYQTHQQQQQHHALPFNQTYSNEIYYNNNNNTTLIDFDNNNNNDTSNLALYHKFTLYFNIQTYQFLISIGIIVFNIFLPLQLDKAAADRWGWWAVFLPLWISLLIWLWSLCSYTFIKCSKYISTYSIENAPLWIELIIYYISWISVTVFTIVLSVELDGSDPVDPLNIFSPVIILIFLNFWVCFFYIYYYKRELKYLMFSSYDNSNENIEQTQQQMTIQINYLNK